MTRKQPSLIKKTIFPDEMTVEDLEAEMQAANELQTEGQGEAEVRDSSSKMGEEEEHVLDELPVDIEG